MENTDKRCEFCGRPLSEGEICGCKIENETKSEYVKLTINKESVQKIKKAISQAGKKLNEDISNNNSKANTETTESVNTESDVCAVDGAFEKDLRIVDKCIVPTEREVHIRQYKIAEMKTPFLKKAFGRLQVTNKRVIFRSAGKSFLGPIITEKEFSIEELSGIEIKSDYNFSFPMLIVSILEIFLLTTMFAFFAFLMIAAIDGDAESAGSTLALVYIIAGVFIYASEHKARIWVAALFFAAGIIFSTSAITSIFSTNVKDLAWNLASESSNSDSSAAAIWAIFSFLSTISGLIMTILAGFVDDLQIIIKIKGAHDAINISRKRNKTDWTGFLLVKPWKDTNLAIQELGALITDVKQQGDNAIKKWCV